MEIANPFLQNAEQIQLPFLLRIPKAILKPNTTKIAIRTEQIAADGMADHHISEYQLY
jgi:hypothetical protein